MSIKGKLTVGPKNCREEKMKQYDDLKKYADAKAPKGPAKAYYYVLTVYVIYTAVCIASAIINGIIHIIIVQNGGLPEISWLEGGQWTHTTYAFGGVWIGLSIALIVLSSRVKGKLKVTLIRVIYPLTFGLWAASQFVTGFNVNPDPNAYYTEISWQNIVDFVAIIVCYGAGLIYSAMCLKKLTVKQA